MPARDPELAAALKKPFAEQVAFFRAKLGNLVPTARWDDLWQAEHDRAFMVAGAAKADLLADLAAAVDKAIAEGETLQGFRKRFAEIVDRHGWHGWTGEATAKGRAWRTRVIYETNLITSYAAGRHAQLQAGGYDYWIYKHSDFVSRPRPHHVALDGITRRADDPFWQTHYPPNGWNCFPGHTLVRADAALGQRFFYRGQMVDFWTAGKRLTVTANHPVLTRRGWVSACEIKAGDEVIQAGVDGNAVLVGIVHNPQPPARADQLFEALAAQGLRIAPMAAHDFYGDAASGEGEVHIAGADGVLVDVIHSAAGHGGGKFSLDGALAGGIESSDVADSAAQQALVVGDAVFSQDAAYRRLGQAESPGDGRLAEVTGAVHGEDFALDSFISGIGRRPRGRHEAMLPASDSPFLDPSGFHSVAAVSDRDVVQSQDSVECATGVSKLFGELIEANAGLVSADKVIGVRQFDWAGHVYDFSTETGLIVAGGLIVSNCRCRVVGARGPASIRRLGGDPDKPLPEWVGRIDPKTQAPVGIDKGFAYAPGHRSLAVRRTAEKLGRHDPVLADMAAVMAQKTVQWPTTIAKAYMSGVPATTRDLLATAIRIQPETGEAARRYAERALGMRRGARIDMPTAPYQTLGLLTTEEAARIAELTGMEAVRRELYDWAIDQYAPRHILREHGDEAAEARRGQTAVVIEDYALLPSIIGHADRIEYGGTSDAGRAVVLVARRIGGIEYVAVFEILPKRRMLALKTMRKLGRPPVIRP